MFCRFSLVLVVLFVTTLDVLFPWARSVLADPPFTQFGDPLPGLSAVQLQRFQLGKAGFEAEESDTDGIGRAETVDEAIRLHDGQGRRSKARFEKLPSAKRIALLEFLDTL